MWLLSDGKPGSSILLSPYCPTIHLSKTLLLVPHLMAKEMTNFRDHQCFFIRCDYLIMSSFSEVKIQKQEITESRFRKYYVPIPQKRMKYKKKEEIILRWNILQIFQFLSKNIYLCGGIHKCEKYYMFNVRDNILCIYR